MKRLCKSFSLIFLIMFSFLGFAEIGNAYCVHNDSSISLWVSGDFCYRCLLEIIQSGDSGCCPGQDSGCGGNTTIYVESGTNFTGDWFYTPCQVTSHGDVFISGTNLNSLLVTVYDDNHNLICAGQMKCCYKHN